MTIDRRALVSRHNPRLHHFDLDSPLSVGNGELAYTADLTGMQTFGELYDQTIPLCTQSHWGWHTSPLPGKPAELVRDALQAQSYNTYGRNVGYNTRAEGQEEAYNWLRQNPHRLNLARIGLHMTNHHGQTIGPENLSQASQELDLWHGVLHSDFTADHNRVSVRTCCHPYTDMLAFAVDSHLIQKRGLDVLIAFPYATAEKAASDWNSDDKHSTKVISASPERVNLLRIIDDEHYFVSIAFSGGAKLQRLGYNTFLLKPSDQSAELRMVIMFSQSQAAGRLNNYNQVEMACREHWQKFWQRGGAIQLSGSLDPRAGELERRIVLSQYLTAIQCAGSLPPQETGLTCNSWYGKFHLEMHWWHAAHFFLWNRPRLIAKSLWWYHKIINRAVDLAAAQGYSGARWPKMTDPSGYDSPSPVGPLLIWQQPHPIFYAELAYRQKPNRETLLMYQDIVLATAEFMASYLVRDQKSKRYVLGPPVIPAQENHAPQDTLNPSFELEYWAYGLITANIWRKRLGMSTSLLWQDMAEHLAALPIGDGVYLAHENCPDTFSRFNYDHPSMLGALGILPGSKVDRKIMNDTLDKVLSEWKLDQVWGWDFPMIAMTAARLGRPEQAVDALLLDSAKNEYVLSGHNKQGPRKDLPLYLPGNGGLLYAAALMAAGWDGCPDRFSPGFPDNGQWQVEWEGLQPAP